MRLFSNRSQMTSKCGKHKKVAHEVYPSVSLMFLPDFDVLCDLFLNRHTATWNLFVLYSKKLKYTEKCLFISNFATLTDTKIALAWSNVYTKWSELIGCYDQQRIVIGSNSKFKKLKKNLNPALSSSMRLSSNRSWARTNQNALITWVII